MPTYLISMINRYSYIISPIFYKIVYMSIIASLIGITILTVEILLKKRISKKYIVISWTIFILALIIDFRFVSNFSIQNIIGNRLEKIQNTTYRMNYDNAIDEYRNNFSRATVYDRNGNVVDKQYLEEKENAKKEVDITYFKSLAIDILIPYAWFIVVILTILPYFVSYIIFKIKLKKLFYNNDRVNKIFQQCKNKLDIKGNIRIVITDKVNSPCLFGVFNSTILINNDMILLDDEELTFVIMHELSHYKRKDPIYNIIITILKCIYFFNPVVIYCLIKIRNDIEALTDSLALQNSCEEEKKKYCNTLLKVASTKNKTTFSKGMCISSTKNELKDRIKNIKFYNNFKEKRLLSILISVTLIILLFLVFFTTSKKYEYKLSNIDLLKKYQDTYIGDNSKVIAILDMLPFSNHRGKVELQTKQEPYELTINYNMEGNENILEYNSIALFSTINNLSKINYNLLNDNRFSTTRDEAGNISNIHLDSLDYFVNTKLDIGISTAYRLTVNKNCVPVFVNKDMAYEQFKVDYKDEIDIIRKQFKLFPLTIFNYSDYKKYGWQVTNLDEEIQIRCGKISQFFDIYENSDSDTISPNSGYSIGNKKEEVIYPFQDIKEKIYNLSNDIDNLSLTANRILISYFEGYNSSLVKESQRITNFVPMDDIIVAGDVNEFVAEVYFKLISEYKYKNTYWGTKNSNNEIVGKVKVRIKISDDGNYYNLTDIGNDVKTDGLK